MEPLFDALQLTKLLNCSVERWHAGPIIHDQRERLMKLVLLLQSYNFELWHEEDLARDPTAGPEQITQIKHKIDRINQRRNNTIEKLDEQILDRLEKGAVTPAPDAKLHSETVGSIVDRLSIMALKIFHMREQTQRKEAGDEHRKSCRVKLEILMEQQDDLTQCLETLREELQQGRRRFKLYRQMKMYNDPNLNPVLYSDGLS